MMNSNDNPSLTIGDENPTMPEGYFDESKLFEDSNDPTGDKGSDPNKEEGNLETPPSPDDGFIKISRKDLANEIERLRLEDKEFAQVFSREVGNKAAQRYKPQIDLLSKNNDALNLILRQREIAAMPQEEITNKFATDPIFAKEYGEVIHAKPQVIAPPNEEQLARQLGSELSTVMGFAKRVLTDDQFAQLQKDASEGKFDVDDSGEIIPLSNWPEAVERLQSHVAGLVKQPVVTPPVVNNTPTPPVQRQDTANPDMSNGGGRQTTRQIYTMAQVRAMNVFEQMEKFPGINGIEDAIDAGIITLEGR